MRNQDRVCIDMISNGSELSGHEAASRHGSGNAATLGAADLLCLAAAPAFALMALLTGVSGGAPDMLCSAAHGTSPLSGMVPMYLLMSIFHSVPWLKRISSWRNSGRGWR